MATHEIYFSTDIESDGPIPGPNSMLSYGSAAFDEEGKLLATFSENLLTLPEASGAPDTMAWWSDPARKEAWEACRKDPQDPVASMKRYVAWVESVPGVVKGTDGRAQNVVFVAYPAGFDFTYMYQYMIRFAGYSPFGFSALDMKSYAMAVLGEKYRYTIKRNMPKSWFGPKRHNHVALDDAIEQGELFCQMLKAGKALKR